MSDSAPSSPREPVVRLAYMLARHIEQAELMPVTSWNLKAQALLLALRELDPARYDREVPPKKRLGQGPRPA